MGDIIYSFATAHPGALVLNNYPRFLQQFQRPDNDRLMDLAATDILRTRELGVPRYNQFRRLLHLQPAAVSRNSPITRTSSPHSAGSTATSTPLIR